MNLSFMIYSVVLLNWASEAHLLEKRAVNCPKIAGFTGRVRYRKKGMRAQFRCKRPFTRYGAKFAICQPDGTWDAEPPLCVKDGCIPLDASKVYNLDMDVQRGVVTFKCLENYVLIGNDMIHCDGAKWSGPLPRCAAPHEMTECDFELDLCGWSQGDTDESDWIRNSGITPTGDTGPIHDHTFMTGRNGHYMYFETSAPTETGDTAELKSPPYPKDLSPICFDFWYHMEGSDVAGHVGELDVYVIDESEFIDDDDVQPVFIKSGNQGPDWQRGEIYIDQQDEPYQIVMIATKRDSYKGDIAIDDVRLYNCTDNSTIGVTTTRPSSVQPSIATPSSTHSSSIAPTSTEVSSEPNKKITKPRVTVEQQSTSVSSLITSTPVPTTTSKQTVAPTTEKATVAKTTERPTTSTTMPQTTMKQTTPPKTTTKATTTTLITTTTARLTTAPQTITSTTKSSPTTYKPIKITTTVKVPSVTTTSSPAIVSTNSPTTTEPVSKRKTLSTTATTTASPTTTLSTKKVVLTTTTASTTPLTSTRPASTSTPRKQSTSSSTVIANKNTSQKTSNKQVTKSTLSQKTAKVTKKPNSVPTKTPENLNTTRSKHPEDDTLKPLMIGLGVGIVAGLIIIGVIAYVCARRRKFYTSRYEDELKPITNAVSVQSLNTDHFYKDEEYES